MEQRQLLTPRMIQSMEILQLPLMALEERIEQELEANPVLERRGSDYDAPDMYTRTDSWFITIAPLERPQVAIAVVVEGGGFGATTAAPIAASVILKARELGLLGDQYKPKTAPAPGTKKTGKK